MKSKTSGGYWHTKSETTGVVWHTRSETQQGLWHTKSETTGGLWQIQRWQGECYPLSKRCHRACYKWSQRHQAEYYTWIQRHHVQCYASQRHQGSVTSKSETTVEVWHMKSDMSQVTVKYKVNRQQGEFYSWRERCHGGVLPMNWKITKGVLHRKSHKTVRVWHTSEIP